MYIDIILFAAGLLLLIKGGDWFVDSASGIARRFHLPELLIGATVVSIGTTLPEVMVSVQGALAGSGGMAYGNAIGSIICNTSLIAALTITIKPGKSDRKSMLLPVGFFCVAATFYCCVAYFIGKFYMWVGFVLLALFVVYMTLTLLSMKKPKKSAELEIAEYADKLDDIPDPEDQDGDDNTPPVSTKALIIETVFAILGGSLMIYKGDIMRYIGIAALAAFGAYAVYAIVRLANKKDHIPIVRDLFFLIIGAAIIAGGANLLVDSGTAIATELGVPDTVIALTFVALGTSLPELVTAITSLAKGHGALSLGNIIGANLFNLVLVSGASIAISPFDVPAQKLIGGMNASLIIDIPVMLSVMAIMIVPAMFRQKLSRWQGILLLGIYAAFCTVQFVL